MYIINSGGLIVILLAIVRHPACRWRYMFSLQPVPDLLFQDVGVRASGENSSRRPRFYLRLL